MKKLFTILLFGVLLSSSTAVSAQVNILMKVMDPLQINGESLINNYVNWIELKAWQGGGCSDVLLSGGGGSGAGIGKTDDFVFQLPEDKSTYYFKSQMYTGSPLQTIQIDFLVNTGGPSPLCAYRIEMVNAWVTAVRQTQNDADNRGTTNISLKPEKFRYTYWPVTPAGTLGTAVVFGWNMITNLPY